MKFALFQRGRGRRSLRKSEDANKMFSKKKKKIEISAPSNFQHRVHTGFDNSSNKFVGLPKQWASLVVDGAEISGFFFFLANMVG